MDLNPDGVHHREIHFFVETASKYSIICFSEVDDAEKNEKEKGEVASFEDS